MVNAANGTAHASSVYSGNYKPIEAFTNQAGDYWCSIRRPSAPVCLWFQFNEAKRVVKIKFDEPYKMSGEDGYEVSPGQSAILELMLEAPPNISEIISKTQIFFKRFFSSFQKGQGVLATLPSGKARWLFLLALPWPFPLARDYGFLLLAFTWPIQLFYVK